MNKVLHIDIDAFFASVEINENPLLRGEKVVVVGAGKRGVVTSASYSARGIGVKAGLPYKKAKEICPNCVFLPVRHNLYEKYSKQFFNILEEFSPDVEIYSVDEAFIDISKLRFLWRNEMDFAKTLKFKIKNELGLGVTIGIGNKKVSAKIATAFAKPGGICKIIDEDSFLENIEISEFPGIGKATTPRFYSMEINFGRDIKRKDPILWEKVKHNFGAFVLSYEIQHLGKLPFKSISRGETFEADTDNHEIILKQIARFSMQISEELVKHKVRAKRVGVRLRYHDFEDKEKRITVHPPVSSYYDLFGLVGKLFYEIYKERKGKIRAVSVSATNIVKANYMLLNPSREKGEKFFSSIVKIKKIMGEDKIIPLRLL